MVTVGVCVCPPPSANPTRSARSPFPPSRNGGSSITLTAWPLPCPRSAGGAGAHPVWRPIRIDAGAWCWWHGQVGATEAGGGERRQRETGAKTPSKMWIHQCGAGPVGGPALAVDLARSSHRHMRGRDGFQAGDFLMGSFGQKTAVEQLPRAH